MMGAELHEPRSPNPGPNLPGHPVVSTQGAVVRAIMPLRVLVSSLLTK